MSEPFRKFVAEKLAHLREPITQKIIARLTTNEDSSESLALLPSYLKQAGDNRKLLRYLSPERFAKLLDSEHQISPVRQKVRLGLETATELNNYGEIMRFAVQSSALSEHSGFTVSYSEISARMELQDEASCIALAQAALLTNDRLRLLTLIARKKRERGQGLQSDLTGEIDSLFETADWKEFSSDSLEQLATDLVYVRPELATQALEKATSGKTDSTARLDIALASASMAAAASRDDTARNNAERLRAGITSRPFLSIFNALSAIFKGLDAFAALEKAKELSSAKAQIFFLRQWSIHSRVKVGACDLISFAFDVAIKETEYTPTATDFRELAEAIRRIDDPAELGELVRRFDAQRTQIEAIGPTLDYFYLQLLLALGESKIDRNAAANRLVEVYSSVIQIKDLAVQTACLARMLDFLPLIDPNGDIRKKEGIQELVCQSFENALKSLLGSTADHLHATHDIIAALVPRHVAMAINTALSLNISSRRDRALAWLVSSMLDVKDEEQDLTHFPKIIKSFDDDDYAEAVACQVLEHLTTADPASIGRTGLEDAVIISARNSLNFKDADLQARACCAAILCFGRFSVTPPNGLKKLLNEKLITAWERMDIGGRKIALGFRISARFATVDSSVATEWLARTDNCRASHSISASTDPYRHCLLLLSRSYRGLVEKRIDQREDLDALSQRIDRVPSYTEQLSLWTDVALRLLRGGHTSEAGRIALTHIQRLLGRIETNTTERYRAIVLTMPVIFHTSKVTATSLLAELPKAWNNRCVVEIANFVMRKRPSWEPFETHHDEVFSLTVDEMDTLCELADKATADITIYWIISTVSTSLRSKAAKKTITGNQRADIIGKLRTLVNSKFPAPGFISHDGYLVLGLVSLAQLERFSKQDWEGILAKASAIPNVADKCLVLSEVANGIAAYEKEWAVSIYNECKKIADDIPSALDRANRLEIMAREVYKIDKKLGKEFYIQALLMTSTDTEPEYEKVRKDIIDSAHQISPDLATSIASAMDDDVARRAKRGVSSRIELLEMRRRLMDPRGSDELVPERLVPRLSEAAWALLGSLNANRVVPVKVSQTRQYLEHASNLPFKSAFAIYSYAIENAIERQQERGEQERILRGLFRSLTGSADLFYFLAERGLSKVSLSQTTAREDAADFCFVDSGQRDKGMSYIGQWIAEKTGQSLMIHDPFLQPTDVVEILKLILVVKPELEVNFITSRVGLQRARIQSPFADQFRSAWADSSSQPAPVTRVVVVSVGSDGDSLVHDRWWCSQDSGLDFGPSFNGLGMEKASKIRIMPKEENIQAAARLAEILAMKVRYVKEKRVVYESADL